MNWPAVYESGRSPRCFECGAVAVYRYVSALGSVVVLLCRRHAPPNGAGEWLPHARDHRTDFRPDDSVYCHDCGGTIAVADG